MRHTCRCRRRCCCCACCCCIVSTGSDLLVPATDPHPPRLPTAGNRKENTVPCSNCKTQLRFDAQTREVEVVEEAKA